MKICSKCGEEKELELFRKDKRCKGGHVGRCKSCVAAQKKQYYKDNIERIKRYYKDNTERYKQYRTDNAEHKNEYDKCYREDNAAKIAAYKADNRDKIAARVKLYKAANRDEIAALTRKYTNSRRKTDPAFKLLHNLRKRLWLAVKGKNKSASTMALVGCSIEHLQEHLENQFTDGMTWENQGKWHVDHIRPCASFDLSKAENQRECFNYTNLQPLWAEDNLRKSDKLVIYYAKHGVATKAC